MYRQLCLSMYRQLFIHTLTCIEKEFNWTNVKKLKAWMATDHKPSTVLWNDLVPVLWNLQGTQSKESSSTPGSESVSASQKNWNLNRDQIANISWTIEKAKEFQEKNIYFCFIDYFKSFDYGSQQTMENSERDGNTRPPDLPPEKSVCRSRSSS